MTVFPIRENSSSKIFSLKYDEIPSVKKSPNFRNVVNKVKTTLTGVVLNSVSKTNTYDSYYYYQQDYHYYGSSEND